MQDLSTRLTSPTSDAWLSTGEEGQLSLDVFRHGQSLVVRATVAGVRPEDLDVAIHGDLLTIRGRRETREELRDDDWFVRECYWGAFSRSLVLPCDVAQDKTEAHLANGVLEIRLPIRHAGRRVQVKWKEEENHI